MTPDRLHECMRQIGWTNTELARRLDVRESSVRMWLSVAGRSAPRLVTGSRSECVVHLKVRNCPKAGRANSSAFFSARSINPDGDSAISCKQKESCGAKDSQRLYISRWIVRTLNKHLRSNPCV
jgi:hypothetical protein